MTDYLTQCNAITAEKKVWRWRTAVSHKTGGMCRISYREDHPSFDGAAVDTEYLGDADGNPIPAMNGARKYVIAADMHGWYIAFDEHTRRCFGFGDAAYSEAVILRDRLNAEANRIAGGVETIRVRYHDVGPMKPMDPSDEAGGGA